MREYPADQVRTGSGLLDGVREIGDGSVVQRLWAKPAVTVIGIDTTPIAASSNALHPGGPAPGQPSGGSGGDAAAHRSTRCAPIWRTTPRGAQVTVTPGDVGQPTRSRHRSGLHDAARAFLPHGVGPRAGRDMGMGGSIPFITESSPESSRRRRSWSPVWGSDTQAHSIGESLNLAVLGRPRSRGAATGGPGPELLDGEVAAETATPGGLDVGATASRSTGTSNG